MMITPLLVYYFSVMTLIGFFLSPLAAACAGIVVILVLCAIPLVYLGLGDIPLYGAGILAQLVYEISQWFARLPYTWFAIPKPHWVVLLLYFALLATGYYCLQRWQKQQNLPEIIQPEGILTRVQKM